jgi:two-component system sensor histidine kinase PilS (NtrC family)
LSISRAASLAAHALGARLVALAGVLGLAVLTQLHGGSGYSERQVTALYALVLAGFLLALGYGVIAAWGRRGPAYCVELACDALLIALLVHCTGGSDSPLGFLFIPWILYAALTGGAGGALAAAAVAGMAYAAVALGPVYGWIAPFEPGGTPTRELALTAFGLQLLAFGSVALLARLLAAQVRQGREQLHELGEIHRRIIDNVTSGLLTVDRAGTITSFNRAAERITGWTAAEVHGSALARLFPELSDGGARLALEASTAPSIPAAEPPPLARLEVPFYNRKGERLLLGMSASALRDASGAPEGAIFIFQDLTEIAQMQERLRRSERLSALGQLAAGLAHEIRNPLASLSGSIELLKADLPARDVGSRKLTDIVLRETQRLNRLVSDFLTYAKPGPGRVEPVPLLPLFEELGQLLAGAQELRVQLELHIVAGLSVLGNSDQLRQVFWNLLRNAAEAKPRDARVGVAACEAEAGWIEIAIEDHGAGIPPEALEHIFEPFYTTKAKGTGLGLAMVHRVVEAHGGKLLVSSELGEGTTVRVVLPRA